MFFFLEAWRFLWVHLLLTTSLNWYRNLSFTIIKFNFFSVATIRMFVTYISLRVRESVPASLTGPMGNEIWVDCVLAPALSVKIAFH